MSDGAFEMLFKASGVPQVVDAFRTIEQAQSRVEASMLRAAKEGTKDRIAGARAEVRSRVAATADGARAVERGEFAMSAAALREANRRTRIAEQEGKAKLREADKAAAAVAKAEAKATRAAESEAKKRAAAVLDAEKDLASRRDALAKRLSSGANAVGGAVARGVGNIVNPALHYGAMAATLGGAFSVAGAVQSARASETSAVALSNSAYNPTSEEGKKRIDPKQLQAAAQAVAISNGQDTASVLSAWQGYIAKSSDVGSLNEIVGAVASGDQKKVQGSALMKLANLSTASGTALGDLMGATGSLKTQNDKLSPQDLVEMMQSVVGQGKLGAVEISDLAKYASVATASSGRLVNGETTQKQAQMAALGLTQVSMKAGSSAADASTGVKNFISDLTNEEKAGGYKKAGVTLRSGDGKLRNINDIIGEMFTAKQGRTELMGAGGLGIGNEGMKVLEGSKSFYDNFLADAEKKGLKGKDAHAYAGKELTKELGKYTSAKYSDQDVSDDKKAVMDTADKQFATAMEEVSIALQKEVTPFLKDFGKHLPELTKTLVSVAKAGGELAKWLVDNPWKGAGLIIAASVAKELAMAGLSKVAEKGTEKLMEKIADRLTSSGTDSIVARAAGGASPPTLGSTGAGAGAGLGAALSVAAVTIAAMYVTKMAVDQWAEGDANTQRGAFSAGAGAINSAGEMQDAIAALRGATTPEAKEAAMAQVRTAREHAAANIDALRKSQSEQESTIEGSNSVFGMERALRGFNRLEGALGIRDSGDVKQEEATLDKLASAVANGVTSPGAPNRNAPMSAGVRK